MIKLFSILMISCIVGCASTGPIYNDYVMENGTIDSTTCRLVVFRSSQTGLYAMRSASIKIDNQAVGDVKHEGYNVFTTTPGDHVITADMWDSPGKCSIFMSCIGGSELFFQVEPRTRNAVAFALGGAIGSAIETYGKDCGGAFVIRAVEKEVASPLIGTLRLSR